MVKENKSKIETIYIHVIMEICPQEHKNHIYHKYWETQANANSADPDRTLHKAVDQDLHSLLFI